MNRRPDLFIIGAPKSGTTSIYEYLKDHPEVFMSLRKEPRYFAPDLEGEAGHDMRHGRDLGRYLALFADAGEAKRLGEASVRYIYSRQAARLIREFQPKPYIVAMVRNPVDMMYSLHRHRVAGGAETITDFEEAIAAESDRREGRRLPPGSHRLMNLYRDRARYGEQLPRWFDTFGRERVYVIVLEDLVADPAATFRRLLQFLEVDTDYQPPSFRAHNPSHAPRSEALRSLLRMRAPQWVMWKLLPATVGDNAVRRALRPLRGLYRKSEPPAPMRPELRRQLEEEFAADVELVSELLGRDLATLWWKPRPSEAVEVGSSTAGAVTGVRMTR